MQKSKKNLWLIYGFLSLLLIFAAVAIYKSKTNPKGTLVTIAEVEKRNIHETVSASGKIYPVTEVKISSDVSGEIVELYVKEGDSVVVGQVLAKIDPDSYLSAVQRGEASLNTSKAQLAISKSQIESNKAQREQIVAQLENASAIHSRNEKLKKDGVISQAEMDQSKATLKQLEANLRAADASIRSAQQNTEASEYSIKGANASLNELKTNLNRTTIKAPTNGIVSKLSVEKGERVVGTIQMTGTEMMRISNLNVMEVQVDVSENDILKVNIGDKADIEVDAFIGKKFKGEVTHIANSASNISSSSSQVSTDQVTNFIVKVRVDEKSYQGIKTAQMKYPLRPGMSASVDIFTNEIKDAIAVPIQSVTIRESKPVGQSTKIDSSTSVGAKDIPDEVVFVFEADTVKMVKVTTGIQDDEFIYIETGLNLGQKIITGPYNVVNKDLKAGDHVRIKSKDKDKEEK